jgi:GAF domain-containing protein
VIAELRARVGELQRERDHLVAIVDILQEVSASLHFVDTLQAIASKLGAAFGLDRCSIFLTGDGNEIRLVASYEDPGIRNLIVDLNRYPELKRVYETGETVFIPDAVSDPQLRGLRATFDARSVRSIVVVPIQSQGSVIGALFLRTTREAEPFSDADIRFCQVVASLTANALRHAHRFEALVRDQKVAAAEQRRAELRRVALVAYLRRLLASHEASEDRAFGEAMLPNAAGEELDRLVAVTARVLDEESHP